MMSDAELAAIAQRAAEATPGPWVHQQGDSHVPVVAPQPDKVTNKGFKGATKKQPPISIVSLDNHAACSDPACCPDAPFVNVSQADARFIAHARTDIPRLLAELESWRKAYAESVEEGAAAEVRHSTSELFITVLLSALGAERETAVDTINRLRELEANATTRGGS